MKNPIVRDLLKVAMWSLLLSVFYEIAQDFNITSQQLYMVGVTMGVLMCFILDGLSSLIMNVGIIVKLTVASPEDFGKFLSGLGCSINFVSEETSDKTEGGK